MKVFTPPVSNRRSFRREPAMPGMSKANGKKMASYQKGGMVKGFKPCPGCPSPAKCRAAGKCAKAGK